MTNKTEVVERIRDKVTGSTFEFEWQNQLRWAPHPYLNRRHFAIAQAAAVLHWSEGRYNANSQDFALATSIIDDLWGVA